jgi:transmembrane sensor
VTGATLANVETRLEQASAWCMRLAEGSLTDDEQRQFDRWLADDPLNETAFAKIAGTWNMFGDSAATAPEVIAFRTQALEAFRAAGSRRWAAKGRWPLKWVGGIAAALLAVMMPAGLWYSSLPTIYETGIGERQVAMLADGSKVSLDADSEVKVKLKADARDIILTQGRAKFDVAKDALRPFRVHVGDRIVVATGTSFSVELLNGTAHVVLYEGHVAVVNANASVGAQPQLRQSVTGEVDLNPGKELIASLSGAQQQVVPADLDRSLSWEAGQLAFSDEPLQIAVERVNRYSAKKVVIADASIRELPVSGVYNAGDVDAFRVGIQAVMPIRATDDGQVIRLSRR